MQKLPHLVAVNVGRSAPLAIGDRVVRSGIVKQPGPRRGDSRLARGLAGDEQADRVNHGGPYKAAYAYAREDAAWWEAADRPPARARARSARTSRWRASTSPARRSASAGASARPSSRSPARACRVRSSGRGWATRRFPRRFVAAGRPGAYLRGREPGTVQAGDAVAVVDRPDHGVTVGLVFEIALRDRARLAELDPARADMNPELLTWLYRAA